MNAAQIARGLGGKRVGNQFAARCPAHTDTNPSLIIWDGHSSVRLKCYGGCTQGAIIAALVRLKLWTLKDNSNDVQRETSRDAEREAERMRALALAIWEASVPAAGTIGETYLWSRELELPAQADAVVRFNPRCPRGKEFSAALVVLMRDVRTRAPRCIQRIYIDAKGRKDKRAASPNGSLTLGASVGAAMMLTDWHNTFWDCLSFCPRLYVCEGLETGLSLLGQGYAPLWALCHSANIQNLPVLFAVGELVICADNDAPDPRSGKQAGQAAAKFCAERWNMTTHQRARIWLPAQQGTDFADRIFDDTTETTTRAATGG